MPATAKSARPITHRLPREGQPVPAAMVLFVHVLGCTFCDGTGYDWDNYDEEEAEEPPICERCGGTGRAR